MIFIWWKTLIISLKHRKSKTALFSEIPTKDIEAPARDANYMNSMNESEAENFQHRLKGLYRFLPQHPVLMQRRLLKGSLLPDDYKEVGVNLWHFVEAHIVQMIDFYKADFRNWLT